MRHKEWWQTWLLTPNFYLFFLCMTHFGSWSTSVAEMKQCYLTPTVSSVYFLYLQFTCSPKSIAITWRRRGSLIQPGTSPRLPLHLPPLLQRSWRASQRILVLLLPRAAVKPLRSLPQTPGRHMRKYLWLFKSRADSGPRTSLLRFPPPVCSNSWMFPYSPYCIGLLSCFPWSQIELWSCCTIFLCVKVLPFEWDDRPSQPCR